MSPPAAGWRYGLLGLPLAFVALPLYVQLPNFYAREFGVPLAALGALLLGARLFDALIDPWIGAFVDRMFARSLKHVLRVGAAACLALAAGFALLLLPQVRQPDALLAWAAAALVLTYAGYSMISVAHQSWGAMLGGSEAQRSRIVAWREGFALAGVLLASVLPGRAGWPVTAAVLAAALAIGLWAWSASVRPIPQTSGLAPADWLEPWRDESFRPLIAAFVVNGVATAIPATLVLFFVQDLLQAPPALEAVFLGTYFACAALSIPLWLRLVARVGLARTWLAGMVLSIATFFWAAALGAGDVYPFILVCALSGVALGTDLVLPGALLAGVIARAGSQGRGEGVFFGWWNFATKLNLALAAGAVLPLLGLAGYAPGTRSPAALAALTAAYCLLPCALKAAAAAVLYLKIIRTGEPR
jgi:Na+/melibiose symporter-like transporter